MGFGVAALPIPASKYAALIELLPAERRFQRSLDIGCGTGLLTARLAACSAEVLGVDLSATAISRARERFGLNAKLNFAQGDLLDLEPSYDESFDLVVVADAIYYLPQAALTDAGLKLIALRLARLLKPGGVLLVANHYFLGLDPDSPRLQAHSRRAALVAGDGADPRAPAAILAGGIIRAGDLASDLLPRPLATRYGSASWRGGRPSP